MRNSSDIEHELDLIVADRTALAEGSVRLTLRSPSGDKLPEWQPGAHVDLVLRADMIRQYSLCGDPADRSCLQVAVLREKASRGGSRYVHDELKSGGHLKVRGPRNHFGLVDAESYLFIAGGIGITPILPMIAEVDRRGMPWQLLYGGRSRSSMAFRSELEQRYGTRVSVCPEDETGLLDLENVLAEPTSTAAERAVYCCGPEGLLSAVEKLCVDWPSGALHIERFTAAPDRASGPNREFAVELAQTGLTLTVPADRSILEVVEAAGVDVLHSCRDGVCGTCETPVLNGVPDHRDSILTDAEREEGASMMICCSRSCSDRLVLDL
ncbi:PDR/VanB family oxidoreductase [Rhodococcus sp. LB1]|uniref:PDR/VanB family oxidoreductase n=1 Tax=Rhodococcus sp. LB1 TaxID=1807499 RepID=UPI00077A69F0|nr:PDR/VanB family oxidoreductase [Rhodococcus sp. LB1]KXX55884.1 ferredoxin [Rhodococcus sp. LB1]